mmetsp:Transcript_64157/g.114114  ORF Transcript_64157/g.114114 Transcript_64157/m.114114 type:complete len:917 (+) Transcript_64157:136-2886(+)
MSKGSGESQKGSLTESGRNAIEDRLEELNLAGEGHTAGPDEAKSLLAIMQVPQHQSQTVMEKMFPTSQARPLLDIVDCISEITSWGDQEMEVLLHRVGVFQQAFLKVDIDGSGTLTLKEVFLMMDTLGVDKSFAADLMAFLDDDGSGEISWLEFVEGISSKEFKEKFPHVTLEAICTMPSCMDGNKYVSQAEEEATLKDLPSVERFMHWMLTKVYGDRDSKKEAYQENVRAHSPATPVSVESRDVFPQTPPGESMKKARQDIATPPAVMIEVQDIAETRNPILETEGTVLPHQLWMHDTDPDLSCTWQTVQTAKKRKLVVVTKTQPRNASAVMTGVVSPKGKGPKGVQKQHMQTIAETQRMLQSWQAEYELSLRVPQAVEEAKAVEEAEATILQPMVAWSADPPAFQSESSERRKRQSSVKLARSITTMKAMKVEETKAHVLTQRKTMKMWACIYGAVFGGVLAGVGAALLAKVLNDFVETFFDPDAQMIEFNIFAGLLSCVWSIGEMMVCCVAAIAAAAKMSGICGIVLVPMDHERAMLAGSLARSALELGHPQGRFLGVNPHKKINKNMLLINTLIYMSSRGATKFIVKMAVKKIAPRTAIKFLEFAPLASEIALNVMFNYLTVRFAMSEVMVCCIGPSAGVEGTSQLIKTRHERLIRENSELRTKPLPDQVKRCCLRAVGICITTTMSLHPNTRHLLQHLTMLFIDEGFIRRSLDALSEKGTLEKIASRNSPMITSRSTSRSTFRKSISTLADSEKKNCLDYMCCCCASWIKRKIHNLTKLEDADVDLGIAGASIEALGLDDEEAFFEELQELEHDHDWDLVLCMLVLGFLLDGRLTGKEWRLIQKACRFRNPPREPSRASLNILQKMYQDGKPTSAADFLAVVCPEKEDEMQGFTASIVVCLRSCLGYLNIF